MQLAHDRHVLGAKRREIAIGNTIEKLIIGPTDDLNVRQQNAHLPAPQCDSADDPASLYSYNDILPENAVSVLPTEHHSRGEFDVSN